MTREEVIALANKAGINVHTNKSFAEDLYIERLERFTAVVAAHKREQYEAVIRELLEALRICSGFVEAFGQPEVRAMVREAIAKARGEA